MFLNQSIRFRCLQESPKSIVLLKTTSPIWSTKLESPKKYSTQYLKKVNGQISCVFSFGVKFYNVPTNPCSIYSSPTGEPKKEIQFWTLNEFKTFINVVDKIEYRTAYEILFWCGIRTGELLAMNVGDIQFNNNLLSINKNYAKLDNQELILTPKTKKSKRLVEIPPFLAEHIKEYLTHVYDYDNDARLFTISRPALRVNLNQYAKQAGVKQTRLHDLRHSHASLLIEFLGCSPNVVSDRLGHANVKTTLQTYAHLYPHTQTVICEKLEKLK